LLVLIRREGIAVTQQTTFLLKVKTLSHS